MSKPTQQHPSQDGTTDADKQPVDTSGPLAWMTQNTVAANLLMVLFIVGGIVMLGNITKEVFPEVQLDVVSVQVPYPGASPEEVEQGVLLAAEEAIRGVDGIDEIRSTASEGAGVVTAELITDTDAQKALNDIKSEIDRVTSFPRDAERPIISLSTNRRSVLSVIVYGDVAEASLNALAERVRSDLLAEDNISAVEVTGIPDPEISIEVPQQNLRRYNLTLEQVSRAVDSASVELPGGAVRTDGGEILLRTTERRQTGEEFMDIAIKSQPDGTTVTLGDIATVVDGFAETDREAFFNGQRALKVEVFRVGDQSPNEISETVRDYVDGLDLPPSVQTAIWNDSSELYTDRVNLLLKNAALGLLLVLLLLGIFLEARLAFWVTLGIFISFLGAMLFMPWLGVSINMVSLFAFILALGIVVDDAIVIGEAAYAQRHAGRTKLEAAIAGTREVAVPVVFAVFTTVVAFTPLLFVPGVTGKLFQNIPMIVIPILLISLVEALIILPAHLAHIGEPTNTGILGAINRLQQKVSALLETFVDRVYYPSAARFLKYRYVTLAASVGLLAASAAFIATGRISFNFMPKIEGDQVSASVELPFGTDPETTREIADRLIAEAQAVLDEASDNETIGRGIYADVGSIPGGGGPRAGSGSTGGHLSQTTVSLVSAAEREMTSAQFTKRWRERVGEIPGVESLRFNFNIGANAGEPVAIELRHEDRRMLEQAATALAEHYATYNGVFDIDNGFRRGKEQLDLRLKPAARALGITESDLARQVRSHFFGAEAKREQRGRKEMRVYVRLPESQRDSEFNVEQIFIRTPEGGEMPLDQAAHIERGHSYTSIEREGGGRIVDVTADVDANLTSANEVIESVRTNFMPGLLADYPGLSYELSGEQKEQRETFGTLGQGFLIALVVMFGLMAVVFRSYLQPLVIMFAIPFGLVGALAGHLLMGFDFSVTSIMGIVALSGVVVNDSLVLIAAVNDYRKQGKNVVDAVALGAARRFRPILLTSLTTFLGLTPMILETSVQAQFLVPMAISLGFGVLFVTAIALIIVPAAYMATEDLKLAVDKLKGLYK